MVVNAEGREPRGTVTRRPARVAVSWLRVLAHDLSPAAMPAPPLAARSGWSRRAVLACAVVVPGLGSLDLYQHYRLSAGASVLVCLSRPLAGWWLELAAAVLTALAAQPVSTAEPWPWPITSVFALVVVLVIVGLRAPRRVLVELWLLLALLRAAACLAVPDRRDWRGLLTMVVVSAIALLLADAWRERNETGRRLTEQEQISQAERTRRVVLEERTRIARELHDVVAHHMSVIAIQAEAAPYRVPDPPGELTSSFATIRGHALQALAELRRVLGVLRAERDDDQAAPQPTLDRLGELVAGVRGAGLAVQTAVAGTPRPLPAGLEVSAYRIVQEALSNAMRHAPGSEVRVEITYAPAALRLHLVNGPPQAPASAPPGPGQGLLGMRERAAMLGGELTAAPTAGGGYAVTPSSRCRRAMAHDGHPGADR